MNPDFSAVPATRVDAAVPGGSDGQVRKPQFAQAQIAQFFRDDPVRAACNGEFDQMIFARIG